MTEPRCGLPYAFSIVMGVGGCFPDLELMEMADLKTCPFCAEADVVVDWQPTMMRNHVACLTCGCSVPAPNDDPSEEGARKAWNTRDGKSEGETR